MKPTINSMMKRDQPRSHDNPKIETWRKFVDFILNDNVLLCHMSPKFKKGPGGYLIRVDLIRFPGSIPGASQIDER